MKTRKHYYSSFFLMIGSFIKKLFKPKLRMKMIVSDVYAKSFNKRCAEIFLEHEAEMELEKKLDGANERMLSSQFVQGLIERAKLEKEYLEVVEEFDKHSDIPLKKIIEAGKKEPPSTARQAQMEAIERVENKYNSEAAFVREVTKYRHEKNSIKKSLEIGTSALMEIYSDSTFMYALQCGHNLNNVICTTLMRKKHDHYMWFPVEFRPYWLPGVLKETFPHIKDLVDIEKITYEDFEKAVKTTDECKVIEKPDQDLPWCGIKEAPSHPYFFPPTY